MGIRCSAKAVILSDDCILANQSVSEEGEIYYEFPGGGQNIFEDMETAVAREVLEETGYQIRVERLLAVAEEIYDDPAIREKYPDYTHRIFHIF
jgi:8-oxo-dGTP diphosphatase